MPFSSLGSESGCSVSGDWEYLPQWHHLGWHTDYIEHMAVLEMKVDT